MKDGLTTLEAADRLKAFGPNATAEHDTPLWRRLADRFWAPVPWMLEAAALLELLMHAYVQALVIAGLVVFNALLGFVQEGRAEATLKALRARLALSASAKRDGAWTTVAAEQLVPGDVVKLSLGTIVPADVRLEDGEVLLDQSMLTGESMPVEAAAGFGALAGALVRRGEAVGEVTATGARTRSGRTAELVRTARAPSAQQAAVMRVVRNLAVFSAGVVLFQIAYAAYLHLAVTDFVPLVLTAVLAAIPVALPATFTLANALGAQALARRGVLPTHLAAIDEAATVDVLCADKTGTLTQNQLAVLETRAAEGLTPGYVLGLAALASSEGGADPVDAAVRDAAAKTPAALPLTLDRFVPFDPASKTAEALAHTAAGQQRRIVKGAFAVVRTMAQTSEGLASAAADLQAQGCRVLAVAYGPPSALVTAGMLALSDPPRPDSAGLIRELTSMGVRTVMVTGDAPDTAKAAARAVGLDGPVRPSEAPLDTIKPTDFAVIASVFPADKFKIVQAFQKEGHAVGMCGDGANDAPALRQAQTGIAVSTATDVAKSAAGIVLTEPGLGGIVAAIREGRITYQRILTYTLRSLTRKIDQMLFLTVGLVMTKGPLLTPSVMVLLMVTGDFLAMSSTTDNVHPSARPNAWRIGALTWAGVILGTSNLAFTTGVLATGIYLLHLSGGAIQTLAAVALVFSGQGVLYVVRERRRMWSSWPSKWYLAASFVDVAVITVLAIAGIVFAPLDAHVVAGIAAASAAFTLVLDTIKIIAFRRLGLADDSAVSIAPMRVRSGRS